MTRITVSFTSSAAMSYVPLAALGYALRRAEVLRPGDQSGVADQCWRPDYLAVNQAGQAELAGGVRDANPKAIHPGSLFDSSGGQYAHGLGGGARGAERGPPPPRRAGVAGALENGSPIRASCFGGRRRGWAERMARRADPCANADCS
jgi:hypothetical protein